MAAAPTARILRTAVPPATSADSKRQSSASVNAVWARDLARFSRPARE